MIRSPRRACLVVSISAALLLCMPLPSLADDVASTSVTADTQVEVVAEAEKETVVAAETETDATVESEEDTSTATGETTTIVDTGSTVSDDTADETAGGATNELTASDEDNTTDTTTEADTTTSTDAVDSAEKADSEVSSSDTVAGETTTTTLELDVDSAEENADSPEAVSATAVSAEAEASTLTVNATAEGTADAVPMYRIYNPWTGEHLFTLSSSERDSNVALGWQDEGIAWQSPQTSSTPVYRLYNPYSGDHHYTTGKEEYDYLGSIGWNREGIGFYSADNKRQPVYRLFNPYETVGTHHYTMDSSEYEYLGTIGWKKEGIGWYAFCLDVSAEITDASGSTQQIAASQKDWTTYLVLPSYANTQSVKLHFSSDGQNVSATVTTPSSTINVSASGASTDFSSLLGSTLSYRSGNATGSLVVIKSANVDTVFINSVDSAQGRAWVEASADHSAKADVDILVLDSDGSAIYDKDGSKHSTIKGRGNNTWGLGNKKPYQISLNKKADLLQTGDEDNANKKWILLAGENDPTLLHTSVGYDMGLELGLVGCEGTPVDLYYDGEYRGSYYLCEKAEIKDGRVDIHSLEDDVEDANEGVDLDDLPTAQASYTYNGKTYTFQYVEGATDPDDVSGGYLVEKDGAYYQKEKCWFETSVGVFVVKSPEVCSKNAVETIARQFQQAIDNMQADQFNLEEEYSFDLDSLAKSQLINEFCKNIDYFTTSTYFYKDLGTTTIYCQPLWDFDASLGVRYDGSNVDFTKYSGYSVPGCGYLRNIPSVRDRSRQIWREEFSPLMHNVVLGGESAVGENGYLHSLAYYRARITASQKANETLFGISHFDNEFEPYSTYEENYQYLVNWLTWRTEWFDSYYGNTTGSVVDRTSTYNGVNYGLVYDYEYYVSHSDVIRATGSLNPDTVIAYFVEHDMANGVQASLNFNPKTYRSRYSDLDAAFGGDWASYYNHYMTYGFFEDRSAV